MNHKPISPIQGKGIPIKTKTSSLNPPSKVPRRVNHTGQAKLNVPQKCLSLNPSQDHTPASKCTSCGRSGPKTTEIDDLRKRLKEIEEQLSEVELKWNSDIEKQEQFNKSEFSQLLEKQNSQIQALESQPAPVIKPSQNVLMLKARAEELKATNDPRANDAWKQYKQIEGDEIDSRRWCQMHEISAKIESLKKAHIHSQKILKDKHEASITHLKSQKSSEECPIQAQIDDIKKRLGFKQAKIARSTLARKP